MRGLAKAIFSTSELEVIEGDYPTLGQQATQAAGVWSYFAVWDPLLAGSAEGW